MEIQHRGIFVKDISKNNLSFKKFLMKKLNEGRLDSLYDSILVPEVKKAFNDWFKNSPEPGIVIGGLVLGVYSRPRTTTDIDLLFVSDNKIPTKVHGFKKIRDHSFEHIQTGVEIEVLTPEYLKLSKALYDKILETSKEFDGIKVPSEEGLIALKMIRYNRRDLSDIESVLNSNPDKIFNLYGFDIPLDKIARIKQEPDFERIIFNEIT